MQVSVTDGGEAAGRGQRRGDVALGSNGTVGPGMEQAGETPVSMSEGEVGSSLASLWPKGLHLCVAHTDTQTPSAGLAS